MKKYPILIIPFLFFLSGCTILSSHITFSPADGFCDVRISSRTSSAKISKESYNSLKTKGYVDIGSVRSEDVVKVCWGDDCRNFTCSETLSHKDTTKEVLYEAAARGGDFVILQKDVMFSIDSTTKHGKCVGGHSTKYTEQECSGGYGKVKRVCQNVTKSQYTCTNWLTEYGKKCSFISVGTVWRQDPELLKHVAEVEKENKRLILKKETYIALKNTYKANLLNNSVSNELVSVKVRGKYGFKNKYGTIVIKPKFTDTMGGFSEGLAAVAIGEKDEKKWGFINMTGKWVIRPYYESAGNFSEGLAYAGIDKKFGYINKANEFIINPQFKSTGDFHEEMAWVLVGEKFGYIDRKGNIIIDPQFDRAYLFSNGLAAVEVNKKNGYIDKKANFIIKPQFDAAHKFIRGIAKIEVGYKEGYVNKTGEIFMEP